MVAAQAFHWFDAGTAALSDGTAEYGQVIRRQQDEAPIHVFFGGDRFEQLELPIRWA